MLTYHFHIEGQVQGVGFRPFIYRKAIECDLFGWVSNGIDGVHIEVQGTASDCLQLYWSIINEGPTHARITGHKIKRVDRPPFNSFNISESHVEGEANLLLTPDLATCKQCKEEILTRSNRRYHYPFTTCTQCGPRYSIMKQLPYDRHTTSMLRFDPCVECLSEYHHVWDRRYYSQTNSCSKCGIAVSLLDSQKKVTCTSAEELFYQTAALLAAGKIIAMKGVGGYLLLCDAAQTETVALLRSRKNRPAKPFALLYPDLNAVRNDAFVSETEADALESPSAPIVLLKIKENATVAVDQIAPGLNTLGVMLPYSSLMILLMDVVQKPLVATSGNISGSPIFYNNEEALKELTSVADYFIVHNLPLVVPQDDSVIRFTEEGQRIVLRRSRGLAPTFIPNPLTEENETWLAMGADMKGAFAILHRHNTYISQYLGDLSTYETQQTYLHVLNHLQTMLQAFPARILVDKHPGYFSSYRGRQFADTGIPLTFIQHHAAHLHAVLAENNLHDTTEPVLGVIWDGTGWGDDRNIWGGEFFLYREGLIDRVEHLPYYRHILNDKFSQEPRLAALSLFSSIQDADAILRPKFGTREWSLYHKIITQEPVLNTSSMGRLFDAVASVLGLCDISTYEGEAAMYLETIASAAPETKDADLNWFSEKRFSLGGLLDNIIGALKARVAKSVIAYNFHAALVQWIEEIAKLHKTHKIAFSGGVFQNALLVSLIQEKLKNRYALHFHKQLSPNDECISFGQLADYYHQCRYEPAKDSQAFEIINP